MIEERRKLLLILHSECSYRIEKCAHTMFARKNDRILNNVNSSLGEKTTKRTSSSR